MDQGITGGFRDSGRQRSVAETNFFLLHIDGDLQSGVRLNGGGQLGEIGFLQGETGHGQGRAVPEEDFREASGDDRTDAVAVESLGGVLPGTAAAEVHPGNEDRCAIMLWIVERVGEWRSFLGEADIVECVFAQSLEGDALHETGRNDAVGIDIISGNVDGTTGDLGDRWKHEGKR